MSGLDDGLPGGALLAPIELGYGAAVRARNHGYERGLLPVRRLDAHVISVGNLAVGGTGKTPLVIAIAARLHAAGRRVAVLARGYRGRGERGVNVIGPGEGARAEPGELGDEAVMIARRLPEIAVLTGADRVVLGQRAVEALGADTLVLDDGFQHRRLHRDCDLVLLRGPRPLGNGHLLPRGPLREPVTALQRADLLCLNVTDGAPPEPLPAALTSARPVVTVRQVPEALVDLAQVRALSPSVLQGARVLVAAGIARPDSLARAAVALGATVVGTEARPDHHPWAAGELEALQRRAHQAGARLLTTEKDAVKWTAPPPGAWALQLGTRVVEGADQLWASLGV